MKNFFSYIQIRNGHEITRVSIAAVKEREKMHFLGVHQKNVHINVVPKILGEIICYGNARARNIQLHLDMLCVFLWFPFFIR